MDILTNPIVEEALDAAAPTPEQWIKGRQILNEGDGSEQSYYNMLDAAATTEEEWNAGYEVLRRAHLVDTGSWPSLIARFRKNHAKNEIMPKAKKPFWHRQGVPAGTVILFALIGFLVSLNMIVPTLMAISANEVGKGSLLALISNAALTLIGAFTGLWISRKLRNKYPTPTA